MVKGIGCDIAEISRFEALLSRAGFLEKAFTAKEAERIAARNTSASRAECAAGIWAAKEAVAKALGTGFDGFGTKEIEILREESGRPSVVLHDGAKRALERLGASSALVSVSHDGGRALAFAICE